MAPAPADGAPRRGARPRRTAERQALLLTLGSGQIQRAFFDLR